MSKWEYKLFECKGFTKTGDAKDASRSGKPVKRQESFKSLTRSIINSILKSKRKRLAELGIPRTTMMSYIKKTWKLKHGGSVL